MLGWARRGWGRVAITPDSLFSFLGHVPLALHLARFPRLPTEAPTHCPPDTGPQRGLHSGEAKFTLPAEANTPAQQLLGEDPISKPLLPQIISRMQGPSQDSPPPPPFPQGPSSPSEAHWVGAQRPQAAPCAAALLTLPRLPGSCLNSESGPARALHSARCCDVHSAQRTLGMNSDNGTTHICKHWVPLRTPRKPWSMI